MASPADKQTASLAVLSHIGICTSDINRSLRFYTQALGFVPERSIDGIGAPYDTLTELPGVRCNAHYLKCGDFTLELIDYPDSDIVGCDQRRPMNRLGFTHMTLVVPDVATAVASVVRFGGHAHPETRIDSPYGPMIFCTDPDGVRIELIQHAD